MTADSRVWTFCGALLLGTLLGSAGCSSTSKNDAGTGGTGSGTGGSSGAIGPSSLPVPVGEGSLPAPSGTPGNLKVLDWAGFKSALTYTLDDAQPSQLEHYAELAATGVRMTFFVTSGNAGGNANFDATFTQAVRDGHEIGNHTVHHCRADLTGCSTGTSASLDTELDGCTSYITEHFGQPSVWTAASPYGDNGYSAPDQQRFFLNRGVAGGTIAPNDGSDPFNLPCHAAVADETVDSFNQVIDATNKAGRWAIMLVHTISPTAANWYAPIDISVITGSVSHAQSLGEVWIDSMVNVGAYWRAQKLLSSVTPTVSGDSQTWSWTLPEHFPPGKYLRVTFDGGRPSQAGTDLAWDSHGYYEVSLDAGTLTLMQ
jgi:hypothetical protein